MNDTTSQERGALQMPRLFRRSTGAHAILVGVLGADLAETILLVLIGGLAGPPLAWATRTAFFWLHTSLLADIALVLVLALFAYSAMAKLLAHKNNEDSWGCLVTGALPIISLFDSLADQAGLDRDPRLCDPGTSKRTIPLAADICRAWCVDRVRALRDLASVGLERLSAGKNDQATHVQPGTSGWRRLGRD